MAPQKEVRAVTLVASVDRRLARSWLVGARERRLRRAIFSRTGVSQWASCRRMKGRQATSDLRNVQGYSFRVKIEYVDIN